MAAKVKLSVLAGPMLGQEFLFTEHDTLLFGRLYDCHVELPADPEVSRHHFILEVNPPRARLRDLFSLNGVRINGMQYGGHPADEPPLETAKRTQIQVDLNDGDRIEIGRTIMEVRSLDVPDCADCGRELDGAAMKEAGRDDDGLYCEDCWPTHSPTVPSRRNNALAAEKPACQQCGKEIADRPPGPRPGTQLCEACKVEASSAPGDFLLRLLRRVLAAHGVMEVPQIAGYEIDKKPLGVGGFGAVYLARCKADGRRVALKVLLSLNVVDKFSRERFLRECGIVEDLRHPNIVKHLARGCAGSLFYFVMEYCDGGSVGDLMRQRGGKLGLAEAGPLMLQALDGLAYAHKAEVWLPGADGKRVRGRGVVHRDLKPENILLCGAPGGWTAKISDFGLATCWQRAGYSGCTLTGTCAGSWPYMPREQVNSFKRLTPVSDIWSIGATFYTMLTGCFTRCQIEGQDPLESVLSSPVVPIEQRGAGLPAGLCAVLNRSLAEEPKDRYQTAEEMRAELAAARTV